MAVRPTLAVSIGDRAVAMLLQEGSRDRHVVVDAAEAGDDLQAFRAALERLELPAKRRRKAVLVLGIRSFDLREVVGMPSTGNPKLLANVIEQQHEAFMPKHVRPLYARVFPEDSRSRRIVYTVRASVLELATQILAARGITLIAVLPSCATVLGAPSVAHTALTDDSRMRLAATFSEGRVTAVRRQLTVGGDDRSPIGENGLSSHDLKNALHLVGSGRHRGVELRMKRVWPIPSRRTLATAFLGLALASYAFSPAVEGARALVAGPITSSQRRMLVASDTVTLQTSTIATRIAQIDRSSAPLIADVLRDARLLSNALPPQFSLSDFKLDSAGTELTIVGPSASGAPRILGNQVGAREIRLVGGVSRVPHEQAVFERVTVRLASIGSGAQREVRSSSVAGAHRP